MDREFKIVPIKATEMMLEAGYQAHKVPYATISRIWDNMIANAPTVTDTRKETFKAGWSWGKLLGRESEYKKALEDIRAEAGQYAGCSCGHIDCAPADCWGCRMSRIVDMVSETLGDDNDHDG